MVECGFWSVIGVKDCPGTTGTDQYSALYLHKKTLVHN